MVIPCFRGADLTRESIRSLLSQAGAHELEILLVDNASEQATASLAHVDARVRVLPQPHNRGFAGACNEGLRHATQPFVLILNNDTRAAPHLLARLHQALERDDRIAFVAPVSNRVKGPAMLRCGEHGATAEGLAWIERELCDPRAAWVEDVDTLSGLCLLGRASTWSRLQGFDERFVPGNFEDDDLCLRARLLGFRLVIARGAFVHHEAHRTFQAMGLDITTEVHRQHRAFVAKWQADAAGRATIAALAGDLETAARAAAEARRLYPDWPDADWHVGRWLARQGQYQLAIPPLQSLVRHGCAHVQALSCLCRCHLALGEMPRVQTILRHLLGNQALDPTTASELLRDLGDDAHGRGNLDTAIGCFANALDLAPDDGALLNRLGAAYVEQRQFDQAIPLLERAAAAGLSLAHTNLGICHFQSGNAARALEHFAAAANQLPDDPTAQRNYARACAATAPTQRPAD